MKKAFYPDPKPSFLPRATILQNRYRIVRRLGSGGMGAVYEALDQRLNIKVALKETFSTETRLRRQFIREARLLAKLDHPALPRVSDYFTDSDRAFIVMQFIPGPDLSEIIAGKPTPFAPHRVIGWADQLLDALAYLHSPDRRIIHRDIKPHNLKLRGGRMTLLDFGLAKSQKTDGSVVSQSSLFGFTPRYSPPEQIQGHGTTPRSDIYALGATLYHLFTGVKPPDALTRATTIAEGQSDPLIPAHEVTPEVTPELAVILHRAMALNAEARYPSATKFRDDLRRLAEPRPLIIKEFTRTSVSRSVNDVTVNTTIVRKPARVVVPATLDSYSILKPESVAWVLPEPSRAPALTAVAVLILLLVTFGIASEVSRFAGESASEFGKTKGILTASDDTAEQSGNYRLNLKNNRKSAATSARESGRKNERAKRPNRR